MTIKAELAVEALYDEWYDRDNVDPYRDWDEFEAACLAVKFPKKGISVLFRILLTARQRARETGQKNRADRAEHGMRVLADHLERQPASNKIELTLNNANQASGAIQGNANFEGPNMSSGDKIVNSGQAVQLGGHGNKADVGTMTQSGNQIQTNINWTEAADQLLTIHEEMTKQESDDPDHHLAAGAVKAAEVAARKEDGGKVLQYLRSAPKYIWDVASKVGASLILELLKPHIGM